MRGSTNRRARIAKSLDKRVERLEGGRTEVHKREKKSSFKLPVPARSGEVPLRVDHLCRPLRRPHRPGRRRLPLPPRGPRGGHRPERRRQVQPAALPGRGAGADVGHRRARGERGPRLLRPGARAGRPVGQRARQHRRPDPDQGDPSGGPCSARSALVGDVAYQMPKTLSGGERAKLGLAMLAAGQANVLLLDEPTNNLDPTSIEAVGTMLSDWPGTIVVVSHDRCLRRGAGADPRPQAARRGLHPLASTTTSTWWR